MEVYLRHSKVTHLLPESLFPMEVAPYVSGLRKLVGESLNEGLLVVTTVTYEIQCVI